MQAASASFATLAGNAISASFAQSASFALFAGTATSSSYATNAGLATQAIHALSASFASLATNSLSLGGIPAAGYGQLAVAQSWTAGQAITAATSSGTTLSPNCAASTMFRHQMTASANVAIANPSNARNGMVITFHLINAGSSTATWGTFYKFVNGVDPTLSTLSGRADVIAFQYDATSGVWRQPGIGVF